MNVTIVYRIKLSKRYRKDIRRLQKSHRDLSRLESVVNQLVRGEILSTECHDHMLKGRLKNTRECHIGSDWLLRYAKDDRYLVLLLIGTGDHRRVLGME